jgi:hypothetical protein
MRVMIFLFDWMQAQAVIIDTSARRNSTTRPATRALN